MINPIIHIPMAEVNTQLTHYLPNHSPVPYNLDNSHRNEHKVLHMAHDNRFHVINNDCSVVYELSGRQLEQCKNRGVRYIFVNISCKKLLIWTHHAYWPSSKSIMIKLPHYVISQLTNFQNMPCALTTFHWFDHHVGITLVWNRIKTSSSWCHLHDACKQEGGGCKIIWFGLEKSPRSESYF